MKRSLLLVFLIATLGASAVPQRAPVRMIADPNSRLVSLALRVRAGLDREAARENGLAALVAACILRTPVVTGSGATRLPARLAVAQRGGSLSYRIRAHAVIFEIQALPSQMNADILLLRAALARPDFSALTLNRARRAVLARFRAQQHDARALGEQLIDSSLYATSGAGNSRYGLPATLAGFTARDAAHFFATYYRRGETSVAGVGDLSQIGTTALASLRDQLPVGRTDAVTYPGIPLPAVSRQIRAVRTIPGPWLLASYSAPAVNSRDAAAMCVLAALLARSIVDAAGLPKMISHDIGAGAVDVRYEYRASPARLVVAVDGNVANPTQLFGAAVTVLHLLASAKVQGSLTTMKALAVGRLALSDVGLRARARAAAYNAMANLPTHERQRLIAAIANVTETDLTRVTQRYLKNPTLAIILPRGTGGL